MFAAICVALHAVLEVGDTFFAMFRDDVALRMLMAAIACVGRIVGRMTSSARDLSTFTVI